MGTRGKKKGEKKKSVGEIMLEKNKAYREKLRLLWESGKIVDMVAGGESGEEEIKMYDEMIQKEGAISVEERKKQILISKGIET